MENNNQLIKTDKPTIVDIISASSLPKIERQKLIKQTISNEIAQRKTTKEKYDQSEVARNDVSIFINQTMITLDKKGAASTIKQDFETGSGKLEIQVRGGDSRFILSVISIIGIVLIAVSLILSWH